MPNELIPGQTGSDENPVEVALTTALNLLRGELLTAIADQMQLRQALWHGGDADYDLKHRLEQSLIRVEFLNNLIATGVVLLELQSGKEGSMLWPALQAHRQTALFAVTKQADILVGGGPVGSVADYELHVINSFSYVYTKTRVLVN